MTYQDIKTSKNVVIKKKQKTKQLETLQNTNVYYYFREIRVLLSHVHNYKCVVQDIPPKNRGHQHPGLIIFVVI